jgi:hypothetical protein
MHSAMQPTLSQELEFERHRRMIPCLAPADKDKLLELLMHQFFVVAPAARDWAVKNPLPGGWRVQQFVKERCGDPDLECAEAHY